ncbi:hypothetical protein GQ597_01910 [Gilliamella sp. Pra-s65]|uniref:hypothetical protein n=1 Tax=unclassified Gilliamella TaxID=2685620 RepID=UPI0013662162|nr:MULTISPECIES: hypothetical protein [unclassified Gilliamella]MWN89469.1 hypothetical protein [Gilliamella sp. Pra-s65]MWP72779.1 hypothetical protein [Gilliamella sp. Pra-s52]
MQLHRAVENGYERAYCKMMSDVEMQDAKEAEIEAQSSELYDKLSNCDYLEIEEKIMKAFGLDDVDTDSVQKALKLICYEKAEFHFNEKNKKSFY